MMVGAGLGVLLVLVAGGGLFAVWRVQSSIDSKITRFGRPFAAIPASSRPPAVVSAGRSAPMNLLVFGSDSRISAGDPRQWAYGAQRTDSIMVVHIPADRSGAYVISIPRDSWVPVPGHGNAKINAAFSWGGPTLAIETVEQLTGVRMDHLVLTDFTGFARLTDLLGGVKITVPEESGMGNSSARIAPGTYTMDGRTALAYVRERYTLPSGDLDRIKRQQNWMRAILHGVVGAGAVTDPQKLYDLISAMASSLSTDSGFSVEEMRDLVLGLKHAGPASAQFLTVPVQGTGWSPDHTQSIVLLNQTTDDALWGAVRGDSVTGWLSDTGYPTLGSSVR